MFCNGLNSIDWSEYNQSSVETHILQGEEAMAKQNKSIGLFHFDDIPALNRGIPKIEVTFDIDVNGILNVTAKNHKKFV